MKIVASKRLVMLFGSFLVAVALSAPAWAGSLRQGSTSSGANVTGSLPGEVLWTYYTTEGSNGENCPPFSNLVPGGPLCGVQGIGDNIIRLVNPNGAANGNLAGAKTQTVCAMVYVFDDDQEMGECCGCPLSSAQLATFSVEGNLTANWGIQSPLVSAQDEAGTDNSNGSIAIVAAAPNALPTCTGQSDACNGGCDPTNVPGYSVTTSSNLLGSITHNQEAGREIGTSLDGLTFGLTEIALSDDGGGDQTNLIYLQNQCGALVGNGTGGGICNCPVE
jgi:hypothetical protein